MSEKLVESTEQVTHELLDWDVLKDFDAKKTDASKEALEDAEEIGRKSRRSRGNLGRRALGVVEKLTRKKHHEEVVKPVEEVESEADTVDEEVDDRLALDRYEAVTGRAVQALGQEQFQKMVDDLDAVARKKGADDVMSKFRKEAGVARMDAADLWDAVLMQAKAEKYGAEKDRIKFYYKTDAKDFKRILGEGKVSRQDGRVNALESDIKLAADHDEDGEWKSGYVAPKAGEVTLVFDGSVMDEASFVALGKSPVVGKIDLKTSCLGVLVSDEKYDGEPVVRTLKNHAEALFPAYVVAEENTPGWTDAVYDADSMRQVKNEWVEAERVRRKLDAEVFTDVNYFKLGRMVRPYVNRITDEDVRKIVRRNVNYLETQEGRDQVDEDLARYYAEILDLEYVPKVEYIYDLYTTQLGRVRRGEGGMPEAVVLNRAKIDGTDLRQTVELLGHELWHAKQIEMTMQVSDPTRRDKMTPQEQERAGLYHYNYEHYVRPKVDYVEYREQLVEAEARRFSSLVVRKFDRSVQDSQKPTELLKRKWAAWKRGRIYQGKHERM